MNGNQLFAVVTNTQPDAIDDTVTADEDTGITITLMANDQDLDDDTLVVTQLSQPSSGSAALNSDGTVTYLPLENYHGIDAFTYTISDENGGSDTATVTITVNPINDNPEASDDTATIAEDTAVAIAVLANDGDPDGDMLSVAGVTMPANGAAVIEADETVTYTPYANFYGLDSFAYTVSDGNGGTATATVSVTVAAVNDPPVAEDDSAVTDEDTPVTVDLLANDNDIDGDALKVVITSDPSNGILTQNTDNTLTYTPAENWNGEDSFSYTANDGSADSNVATVTITVAPVNDMPVVEAGLDAAVDEGSSFTQSGSFADPDADSWTATVDYGDGSGTQALALDTEMTWSLAHTYADEGSYTVTVSVDDNAGGVGADALTVLVANIAPTVDAGADQLVDEGAEVLFSGSFEDPGTADTHTYSWDFGDGTGADGSLTLSHVYADNGVYTVTMTVTDDDGGIGADTLTVTVNNVAPVAADDSAITGEDAEVIIDVLVNDTDAGDDTLIAVKASDPPNGTLALNADNTFTYTPAENWHGVDSFTYTANDGSADSNVATVTITVTPVNDPPVAFDDSITTDEDTSVTVDLLANDSDVDGDVLSVTSMTSPAKGTAVIEADGTVTYTPDANFHGFDSFTYTVNDGNGGTDEATVTVTVNSVNDAPVAEDDAVATDEDMAVTVAVLVNDSDVDGDALEVMGLSDPAHGMAVIAADGTIAYTPSPDYHGADSFTYTVSDRNGGTNEATVIVTVNPVNDAPVADDDSIVTDEDAAVTVNLLANDSDVDGDAIGLAGVTQPTHGTVADTGDGTIIYTPYPDWNGEDTFTYTVTDGSLTAEGTVTITVTPVNDAPVLDPVGALSGDEETELTFTATATDPDGGAETLAFSLDGAVPTGAAIDPVTGLFTWTPAEDQDGSYTFSVAVTDSGGLADTEEITITVNEVNVAPAVGDLSVTTDEDTAVPVVLSGSDSDLPANTLGYTVVDAPAHGTLSGTAPALTYTPDTNYNGGDAFTYTVDDGAAASAAATVAITVTPVNDAPDAADDAATTAEDTPVSIEVLANDSDVEEDALAIVAVTDGANGAVVTDGFTVTYTPEADFNGVDAFTCTVSDGTLSADATVTITVTPVNDPPTASDDEVGTDEDMAVTIGVLDNDDDIDGDALGVEIGTYPASGTLTLNEDGSLTYVPGDNFNGVDAFTYTATDGEYTSGPANVTITVDPVNDLPMNAMISAPIDPIQVNTQCSATVTFDDPDAGEATEFHTVAWNWGDGSTDTVPAAGTGCSYGHAYSEAGVYRVTATVTDCGGSQCDAVFEYVVVYDPNGGFVTGGGWFWSPAGAYAEDVALEGKATFGFVSKYHKGADVPTGNTEFHFKVAGLNFHSDVYDWLVVAGTKAMFKGTGTINGAGTYKFIISAKDTDPDRFRIKIWTEEETALGDVSGETVIYDNQVLPGITEDAALTDDADPITAIQGGSIVVKKS